MDSVKAFYKQAEIKIVNTLFSLFWIYNYLFVLVEEKLKNYGYIKKYLVRTNQLVEPNLETWNCIATMTPQFKMVEQYKYGSEEEPLLQKGAIFIRKCDTYRLSFITNGERVEPSPCCTRFLNIMYSHKNMNEPIKVHLDPAYIRNGNEVLSKTFVYRMLCYQYNKGDYVFDDTYELHLMDDKIQKRVLTANDHIVFGNAGYEVVKKEVLSFEKEDDEDESDAHESNDLNESNADESDDHESDEDADESNIDPDESYDVDEFDEKLN